VFILFYKTNSLLRRHRIDVGGPLGVFVIVVLRLLDLPSTSSSLALGRLTSWCSHRHHQVVRPPCGSIIISFRSLDLPPASSSPSSGHWTFLRLCRHLRQFGRALQDFALGVKASLWGACLMALPSTSGCLGAFCSKTFLRSACLEWLC
jgi:hypothetical protein